MYKALPIELLNHVHPQLYFPYFGSLETATHATFAINCRPPEFVYDSLGTKATCWNVTMSADDTNNRVHNPQLTERQKYYFAKGHPFTPDGLGHPHPGGFWSFFNCGVGGEENPFHREHYNPSTRERLDGSLVHLDAVPWATCSPWQDVSEHVRKTLKYLAMDVFHQTLSKGPNITKILVRGRTAATFLERCGFGLDLEWSQSANRATFMFGQGAFNIDDGRTISVLALNQFNNLPQDVAPELLELIHRN